jgi:glycine C-acetyltransferase
MRAINCDGRLSLNINRLRDGFAQRGLECLGQPSNVVPVSVGDERVAKYMSGLLETGGYWPASSSFPRRFREEGLASVFR